MSDAKNVYPPARRLVRFGLVIAAAVVIAFMVADMPFLQRIEAAISASFVGEVLSAHVGASTTQPMLVFPSNFGHGHGHGFVALFVSPSCSVVLMLVPIVAIGGSLVALGHLRPWAVLLALVASGAVMVTINQLRLLIIVVFIRSLGFLQGYDVGHLYVGSAFAVVGFAAGLWVFARVASRERRAAA